MLANEKLQMDLGHFKLEFINGRWKEQGGHCYSTYASRAAYFLKFCPARRSKALDGADG